MLEARLRESGVDGEVLLTYEHEFGYDLLFKSLEVKKLPHQLFLKEAITQFRKRSSRYREWKTAKELAEGGGGDYSQFSVPIKPDPQKQPDLERPARLAAAPGTSLDSEPLGQDVAEARVVLPELAIPSQGVLSPALSASAESNIPTPLGAPENLHLDPSTTDAPPTKRRRIAPTAISADPAYNRAIAAIPTEGDAFLTGKRGTVPQADDASGFLGSGTLFLDQLTQPESVDNADLDERTFAWTRKAIPPGRRIQVAGALKRVLRSNRLGAIIPNVDGEESEQPLPLFGESDDEESLDSKTWHEYQEEERERLAKAAGMASTRFLSKDEVAQAVDSAIQDLEAQWVAEKKPKNDRKAWKMWQDARRNPERAAVIHSAKKLRDDAASRITRFANKIIDDPWSDYNELRQKAPGFLQSSVYEKKYQEWLINILESPRQPPKPSALPKPTPKPVRDVALDDDEEVLTSDSDSKDSDGKDDFIEYDDNLVAFPSGEMDIDWDQPAARAATPASPGSNMEIDSEPPHASSLSSSGEGGNDLPQIRTTPNKVKPEKVPVLATPRHSVPSNLEPIEIYSSPSTIEQIDEVPGFDSLEDIERMAEIGVGYWERVKDAERLVAAILGGWSLEGRVAPIAKAINHHGHSEVWDKHIHPVIEKPNAAEQGPGLDLARLFDAFISKSAQRLRKSVLRPTTIMRLKRKQASFGPFCTHLKRVIRLLLPDAISKTPTRIVLKTLSKQAPSPRPVTNADSPVDDSSDASDSSSSEDMPLTPSKKRRRQLNKQRDKKAEDLRRKNVKLNEEREQRARLLREQLAQSGSVPGDKSRLIVNETKEAHDSLIYLNDRIGSRIKDHQIEGVRFMWNQVVVDSNVRQGCLLAHTMGLGKTMQVITLLVVIAEASASPDPSVRSQIPESLRQSKTLILCPAGLVDNWFDEIMIWAPEGSLGPVRRVDATLPKQDRLPTIRKWASDGGVLIIGYTLFTALVQNDDEIAELLWETPNLVVGDEAHQIKNPNSQRHQASANFKTMNRIAMTGSPLTNNVMDYYAMINWVAPGYLADIGEFREVFGNPIKEGLYADSDASQKRRARKLLKVLNETVGPKVHRKDIQVLFQELPTKKEFIITLPLTDLQLGLYETYIEWATSPAVREQVNGQVRAWSLVAILALVLAHPIIFKTVAEAKKDGSKPPKAPKVISNREDEEVEIETPQHVLHDLLAKVAVRHIEDYALSNKIVVLLRILDECKRVGDKVLVFSHSIPTLDYLENIFKRRRVVYQRLDGHTPVTARQTAIRKFNTDADSQVYLISTRAGGIGLNIYGANRVVIFDFKYTPADEQQAIGRAYRLGQTKPVYVYWLTVGGTFEDTIHNNAIFKTQLASRVVDKKNPDPWSKRFAEYFAMPRVPDQEDLSNAFGQDQVLDALLKDQEVGRLIRKITSTETFEKEEVFELSAEDQQDVEKMLELQRLRHENPEEYRRREHELMWQSRIELGMAPPPLTSYQPLPTDSKLQAAIPDTSNRINRVITIKVPEHMREKRPEPAAPASESSVTPIGPVQDKLRSSSIDEPSERQLLTLVSDPARVSNPNLPSPPTTTGSTALAPAQPVAAPGNTSTGDSITPLPASDANGGPAQETQAADLQPILAAGTQYKTPDPPPPSAPQTGPPPVGSTPDAASILSTLIPSSQTPLLSPNDNRVFSNLLAVHDKLCKEGRHVRHQPDDLVNRVREVLVQNKVQYLPLIDKLEIVQRFSRDPRCAEAVLSGYIVPEQLATMSRPEMEAMSELLNGLTDAQFKQLVWASKVDLNVCTDTHKPPH